MSLERLDVRFKLSPDMHAKLKAICHVDNVDIGEFVEAHIAPIIEKRIHDAMVLAGEIQRQGLTGIRPVKSGKSRESS